MFNKDQKKERQKFSKEEDNLIIKLVQDNEFKDTNKLKKLFPNRRIKQIRERYKFYLNPNLNHSSFTFEEDDLLISSYSKFKGKWSLMTKLFPGRTEISLKYRHRKLIKDKTKENNHFSNEIQLILDPIFQNRRDSTFDNFLELSSKETFQEFSLKTYE
jgi:hypothetical protein